MMKTKRVLILLICSVVGWNGASRAQEVKTKAGTSEQQRLVHIVMINMSGTSREAHVRDAIVTLPVGQRVALQVVQGGSVTITSSTDRAIARVITVTVKDEGRTIPID